MFNQKTWIAASVVFVIILVVLAIQTKKDDKENISSLRASGTLTTEPNTPIEFNEQDADEDGLKDWEEVLWETDPNNPDTDGDGTPDGQEVSEERNPLLEGPDDALDLALQGGAERDGRDPTKTEEFAEAFFSIYIDAKSQGADLSGNTLDLLVSGGLSGYETPTLYTTSDIQTTQNSEPAIHTYGNEVGSALIRNAPGTDNELLILLEATQNKDRERLQEILTTAQSYEKSVRDLLEIIVPNEVANNHIQLINSFAFVAHDLRAIEQLFDDGIVAIQGMQSYYNTSERLISALATLKAYLNANTSFTQNESGYTLINSI